MSNNNTFSINRFLLLAKQHFAHNNKMLMYATIAYVGVIFIVLSLIQLANNGNPHELQEFQIWLITFCIVFGILYIGYSFPSFRTKESSMNYLLLPGSALEKFLLEFITRIGIMLFALPLLYWTTFHLQGYFFSLFISDQFNTVSLFFFTQEKLPQDINSFWFLTLISSMTLLGFVLPFTGATIFAKQPLVKSLFSVAVIIIFYVLVTYVVVEHLGLKNYNPEDSVLLFPTSKDNAIKFFSIATIIANMVMLFVAYRKIKEKEV